MPSIKFQLRGCACSEKESCLRMFLNLRKNEIRCVRKEADDEETVQTLSSFFCYVGTYLHLK